MGAKGTGFTGFEEEELTEDQLKAIEEMEKFQESVENKENISLREFSDYFRVEAALRGQPELLDNKNNYDIYNYAKEQNHPLTDKVLEPGLEGGLVRPIYDNPFSDDPDATWKGPPLPSGFAQAAGDFGRNLRFGFWNNFLDAVEDVSLLPPSDPIERLEWFQNSPLSESPAVKEERQKKINALKLAQDIEIKNAMKKSNPNLTDKDAEFRLFELKKMKSQTDIKVLRDRLEYKKDSENFIKNNPDIIAKNEWHSGELWDYDKIKHAGSVANSVITSRGFMGVSGLAAGIASMFLPIPGARIIGTSMFASSYAMESSNYLMSEADRIERDKFIPIEEYNKDKKELAEYYKKTYPKPTYIKELNQTLSAKDLYDMHLNTHYEVTPDGKIIKKGLDVMTALSIADTGNEMYGAISGSIEQISNMSVVKKALPKGISSKVEDFWPYKTYKGITRRLENAARKGLGKEKLKNYFKLHGIEVVGQMGAESVEEVLQGITQSIVAVGSQSMLDEWKVPDLNVGLFREGGHHGGLTQMRDEALGGALGGGVTAVTGAGKILTGLNEKNINKSIAKLARTTEGTYFYVKKRRWMDRAEGKSKYKIVARVTERDKDTGKVTSDEISNDEIGGTIKLEDGSMLNLDFDNFAEAFNTAELINKAESTTTNKKKAWNFRKVNQGKVSIVEEEGKYYIDIIDNDGNLHERIDKAYDTKGEATKESKQYEQFIAKAKEYYDKYGGAKLKEDPVIVNEQRNREEKIKLQSQRKGITDETTEAEAEELGLRPAVAIAMFMNDDLSFSKQGIQDLRDTILEEDKDINKNPEIILDYLRKGGDWLFEGIADNHNATQFIEEFEAVFQDTENYDKHRAELDKILKPLIEKHDTKERLSKIVKEPPVDEAPTDDDLLIEDTPEEIVSEIPSAEIDALNIETTEPIPEEISGEQEPIPEEILEQQELFDDEAPPTKPKGKGIRRLDEYSDKELSDELAKFEGKSDSISKAMVKKIKEVQSKRKKKKVIKKDKRVIEIQKTQNAIISQFHSGTQSISTSPSDEKYIVLTLNNSELKKIAKDNNIDSSVILKVLDILSTGPKSIAQIMDILVPGSQVIPGVIDKTNDRKRNYRNHIRKSMYPKLNILSLSF